MPQPNVLDAYYCGLEAVNSASLHISKDQHIQFANSAACTLFGYDAQTITTIFVVAAVR